MGYLAGANPVLDALRHRVDKSNALSLRLPRARMLEEILAGGVANAGEVLRSGAHVPRSQNGARPMRRWLRRPGCWLAITEPWPASCGSHGFHV